MLLIFLALFPMASAVVSYLIGRKNKRSRDYFAVAVTVIEFLVCGYLFITFDEELAFVWEGFCYLGIHLKLDGFRVVYILIAAFMWMMTMLASREYFAHYRNRNRYYFFTLITLGATVGVFLSADLFTTFLFFETMSLCSYPWVAHNEKPDSLRAAATYISVAIIGGLITLMGLFLLYQQIGTLEISRILADRNMISNRTLLYILGGCIFVGFAAKAGVYPFHIWLPKAHPVAPSPASALLSGILTKTGIFGVLVLSSQLFLYDEAWGNVMLLLGVITMLLGAILAVFSINFKRTLALSSMSQIGFILFGIGMQELLGHHNAIAVRGTFLHMVNHSLIKLPLFLISGIVVLNVHELDLNRIRGFGRKKPLLMVCFLMGALGIGGIPLWDAYISKTLLHESMVEYIELLHEEGLATGYYRTLEWLFLIAGGLTIAYMLKLFVAIFIERNPKDQEKFDEGKRYMSTASTVAIAGSAVVLPILGFLPHLTQDRLANLGEGFMHGEGLDHAIHYFSLTNLKGALVSIVIGVSVYFLIIRLLLMKTEEDGIRYYREAWPRWLDLEDLVYRPLLLGALPFIGAVFARLVEGIMDHWIRALRLGIFSPMKEREVGREGVVEEAVTTVAEEIEEAGDLIRRGLSYSLLLFSIGFTVTLAYLFL